METIFQFLRYCTNPEGSSIFKDLLSYIEILQLFKQKNIRNLKNSSGLFILEKYIGLVSKKNVSHAVSRYCDYPPPARKRRSTPEASRQQMSNVLRNWLQSPSSQTTFIQTPPDSPQSPRRDRPRVKMKR